MAELNALSYATSSIKNNRKQLTLVTKLPPMQTAARRQQLMRYLADAPDKKVNALYTLLEDELKAPTFALTDEHLDILEQREAEYLNAKAVTTPWEEVHQRIRAKHKAAI
jgi:hypothetical protein